MGYPSYQWYAQMDVTRSQFVCLETVLGPSPVTPQASRAGSPTPRPGTPPHYHYASPAAGKRHTRRVLEYHT